MQIRFHLEIMKDPRSCFNIKYLPFEFVKNCYRNSQLQSGREERMMQAALKKKNKPVLQFINRSAGIRPESTHELHTHWFPLGEGTPDGLIRNFKYLEISHRNPGFTCLEQPGLHIHV